MKKWKSNTCIAVLKNKNGKILVAADRRASDSDLNYYKMPRPKVSKRNGLILAATGDGGLCGLVVDIVKYREYDYEMDIDDYMHNIFYNDIIKALKSKGYIDVNTALHPVLKIPKDTSVELIVVVAGKLYQVLIHNPSPNADYSNGIIDIDELPIPYATGCGGVAAWASLLSTDYMSRTEDRLKLALNIAAQLSAGCDSNCDIRKED